MRQVAPSLQRNETTMRSLRMLRAVLVSLTLAACGPDAAPTEAEPTTEVSEPLGALPTITYIAGGYCASPPNCTATKFIPPLFVSMPAKPPVGSQIAAGVVGTNFRTASVGLRVNGVLRPLKLTLNGNNVILSGQHWDVLNTYGAVPGTWSDLVVTNPDGTSATYPKFVAWY